MKVVYEFEHPTVHISYHNMLDFLIRGTVHIVKVQCSSEENNFVVLTSEQDCMCPISLGSAASCFLFELTHHGINIFLIFFDVSTNAVQVTTLPLRTFFLNESYLQWLIFVESKTKFSHLIPAAPVVSPKAHSVVDPENTVISWEPVTKPEGIEIVSYQVTVERNDPLRVLDVHNLPPTAQRMQIPVDFLEYDTPYQFEVLAKEKSGNQTITVGFFRTKKQPGQ